MTSPIRTVRMSRVAQALFMLLQARSEVREMLAEAEGSDPAILDSLRAAIGPEKNWDLSTPVRLRQLIDTHTKLHG
jgi:hypothetical protein